MSDVQAFMNQGYSIDLWASPPCKPWSKWNVFNCFRLGGKFKAKLKLMQDESVTMIMSFIKLAKLIGTVPGNTVAFEWPSYCAGLPVEPLVVFVRALGSNLPNVMVVLWGVLVLTAV